MENLNDAEFGSDNSGEEAPILVAQRYLNIFRQVHIFNKAKRDEFDEELLSLPQNITDFFKRMPGGRLLVERLAMILAPCRLWYDAGGMATHKSSHSSTANDTFPDVKSRRGPKGTSMLQQVILPLSVSSA